MTAEAILQVQGLRVEFAGHRGATAAVRDVSFSLKAGQTLALVGESGSGKSVTSLAIMGLLPRAGRVAGGSATYRARDGQQVDLVGLEEPEMRRMRGTEIAMIFQEPMSSLNPLFSIGDQIGEMLLLHGDLNAATRRQRVVEMLELVEIPGAASRINDYPHELSGGMRQRVMIALAMICRPSLLIADEPTTALDVTIQAQILDLMHQLQKELGMSILFITHDMGVVAEMADDVAVMYSGEVVEQTASGPLFASPLHPYTRGLLASVPQPGRLGEERLVPIPGTVPAPHAMPPGCAFAPRCPHAGPPCETPVALLEAQAGHQVRCIKTAEIACHA